MSWSHHSVLKHTIFAFFMLSNMEAVTNAWEETPWWIWQTSLYEENWFSFILFPFETQSFKHVSVPLKSNRKYQFLFIHRPEWAHAWVLQPINHLWGVWILKSYLASKGCWKTEFVVLHIAFCCFGWWRGHHIFLQWNTASSHFRAFVLEHFCASVTKRFNLQRECLSLQVQAALRKCGLNGSRPQNPISIFQFYKIIRVTR